MQCTKDALHHVCTEPASACLHGGAAACSALANWVCLQACTPTAVLAPALAASQALLSEGTALLRGLEGGLPRQPPRLQRKHAVLAQHAAALAQNS